MSGTSDIGMMYRQELARRGVQMTPDNLRRLVQESRANPGVIQGLSVQQDAPQMAARSSSAPAPAPSQPRMPTTGSSGSMEQPDQLAKILPPPSAPPASSPLVQPASVASAVNSGAPLPPPAVPSSAGPAYTNLPPETGEPVQQQPMGNPLLDTGGLPNAGGNDWDTVTGMIRNWINGKHAVGNSVDVDAPPPSAPGMGSAPDTTGAALSNGIDPRALAASILGGGVGAAAYGASRTPSTPASMRDAVTPADVRPAPQRGPLTGTTPQDNVLNNIRQSVDVPLAENIGGQPTSMRDANARRVQIIQGPPGTPPPTQGPPIAPHDLPRPSFDTHMPAPQQGPPIAPHDLPQPPPIPPESSAGGVNEAWARAHAAMINNDTPVPPASRDVKAGVGLANSRAARIRGGRL